jgi:hypothetical protein
MDLTFNVEARNNRRLIPHETSLNLKPGSGRVVPGPEPYCGVAFAPFLSHPMGPAKNQTNLSSYASSKEPETVIKTVDG